MFHYFLYVSVFLLNKEMVSEIQTLCKQLCVLGSHANLVIYSFLMLCCATSEMVAKGYIIAEGLERMAEWMKSSLHLEAPLFQLCLSQNSRVHIFKGFPRDFPR